MSQVAGQFGMLNIGNVCYANAAFMAIRGLEWYQYLNKTASSYTIAKIEKIMRECRVYEREMKHLATLKEKKLVKKKLTGKEKIEEKTRKDDQIITQYRIKVGEIFFKWEQYTNSNFKLFFSKGCFKYINKLFQEARKAVDQNFDELLQSMDWINNNRKGKGSMNDAKEFLRVLTSKIAEEIKMVTI